MPEWYDDLFNPQTVTGVLFMGTIAGLGAMILWQLLRYSGSMVVVSLRKLVGRSTDGYISFQRWRRRTGLAQYKRWLIAPWRPFVTLQAGLLTGLTAGITAVVITQIGEDLPHTVAGGALVALCYLAFFRINHVMDFLRLRMRHDVRKRRIRIRRRGELLRWQRDHTEEDAWGRYVAHPADDR